MSGTAGSIVRRSSRRESVSVPSIVVRRESTVLQPSIVSPQTQTRNVIDFPEFIEADERSIHSAASSVPNLSDNVQHVTEITSIPSEPVTPSVETSPTSVRHKRLHRLSTLITNFLSLKPKNSEPELSPTPSTDNDSKSTTKRRLSFFSSSKAVDTPEEKPPGHLNSQAALDAPTDAETPQTVRRSKSAADPAIPLRLNQLSPEYIALPGAAEELMLSNSGLNSTSMKFTCVSFTQKIIEFIIIITILVVEVGSVKSQKRNLRRRVPCNAKSFGQGAPSQVRK